MSSTTKTATTTKITMDDTEFVICHYLALAAGQIKEAFGKNFNQVRHTPNVYLRAFDLASDDGFQPRGVLNTLLQGFEDTMRTHRR
jgi:hypothetical protein